MTIKIILTFIFFIFSFSAYSTNIRVLDFQHVIESNSNLLLLLEKIEKDQEAHKERFNEEELKLESEFQRIAGRTLKYELWFLEEPRILK